MRSFLGICNYYRRFIKDYSRKARALEEICGKNKEKLIWTEICETAFEDMKKALTETPILAYPDFRKDFILDTDASFDTIGAVLSQKDSEGRERVIAYGSHAMSIHEKGYCITRKELLAIYYFCQHFNHYLYGRRFTLRTDHKAITFMLSTKNPITAQFQTWINYLSSLDINMQFRKGINHENADMLSRNSREKCSQCLTEHENAKKGKMKTRLLTIMKEEGNKWQTHSEEIKKIKEDIGKQRTIKYILSEETVKTMEGKIWIPKEKRIDMISETHKLLCHAAVEKTMKYIKQNFDMKEMETVCKEVIGKCEECLKAKTITIKTKEITKQLTAEEPFEKIYIDICGPLKETVRRERYILAIIDQFSRYICLTPIRKQDEDTIVRTIQEKWILKYGAPREIHVDHGKSFESKRLRELTEECGIKTMFSRPHHHNTNGIIERQFRTIRKLMTATLSERKNTNWADIVPEIEYTLNATYQKTLGKSPAEIIFGRKINRLQWYENQQINREEITRQIKEQQNKMEEGITKRNFTVGDKVLIKKEIRTKEQDKYEGPYTITSKNHERQYTLVDEQGRKLIRNVEKIRDFKRGGCEMLY